LYGCDDLFDHLVGAREQQRRWVSGASLCSPFSNFLLGVPETGSICDRDRFAERHCGRRARRWRKVRGFGRMPNRLKRPGDLTATRLAKASLRSSQYRPSNRPLIVKAALRLGDDPAFLFELRLVDLAAREALL
jgi:hypothetical protein